MSDYNYGSPQVQSAEYDAGLRSFMLGTYRWMIIAMITSAVVGWGFSLLLFEGGNVYSPTALYDMIYGTPIYWALWLAPMGFMMIMGSQYHKLSVSAARMVLFGYSALIGIWLSSLIAIMAAVEPVLLAKVFFMSAALFASISVFGYVTKINLGPFATFLTMAFMGVIIALVVNMLIFKSPMFDLLVSCAGLVLVAGITAWQVQSQKQIYYAVAHDAGEAEKASVFGAIGLYTSFINIFLLLLRIMGRE